jgi:hypothetical protein
MMNYLKRQKKFLLPLLILGAVLAFESLDMGNKPAETAIAAGPDCGLGASVAFCDNFNQPSSVRGRAGDLDPSKWGVGRLAPSDFSGFGPVVNPVKSSPIPQCRGSFANVYPPNDTLICDASGNRSAQLMTASRIQNYGNNSYMVRQPFDFAGRTGKIVFDVDAVSFPLGTYIAIDITDDPAPAPTFREYNNNEVGPIPKNAIMIKFANRCGNNAAPLNTMVYNNYNGSIITPTVERIGSGCANVSAGNLNHFEVRLSQSQVEVWGSDFSTDNGNTFPNFHLLYSANISLNFTRGYVHFAARNHASDKYGFGWGTAYRWDNIGFDGPILPVERAYEIPDNTTMGTFENSPAMNLGYMLLDGTTGKPAGIYDPNNRINSLQFQGVNVNGATSARLTLNARFNPPVGATTGWSYRFNGGTWRNRILTSTEVSLVNDPVGIFGNLSTIIDVPLSDLVNGTNTFEMLPLQANMGYPPVIANIDLLVAASGTGPTPPPPPPSDTIPPTVTISTPSAGATVAGSTAISANAADNVGVAGVQFRINGVNLGAEDTSAPYSVTWDTAASGNGARTVSAVARDTSGNTATSSSVTVTVNNGVVQPPGPPGSPDYPLFVGPTGRYLVDLDNVPVFINGESAWLLSFQTREIADQYLADRQSKGVNHVLVSLIPPPVDGAANSYGEAPFTGLPFATPNEDYFANIDYILNAAAGRGINVLLAPVYLGYQCGSEGWCQQMQNASTADIQSFATYVGTRYKYYDNIIWVMGGDADPSPVRAKEQAFVDALMAADNHHLITVHNGRGQMGISTWPGVSWIDLNSTYTDHLQTPVQAQQAYNVSPSKPFFQIEGWYENEHGMNAQQLRSQNYWTNLSGGSGHVFGNCPLWKLGTTSSPGGSCPGASAWPNWLNSAGSMGMMHAKNLFTSKAWTDLVPDFSHTTLTAGYGSLGQADYVAAARTSNGNLLLAYTPSVKALTVDMARFTSTVTARWYDPTNGNYSNISGSPFANSGSRQFTPAGNNAAGAGDWVLVLEATGGTPNPAPPPPPAGQTPFNGPHNIPGRLEVEDFDNGGEGVAYHDLDGGNNGGAYRTTEQVDIQGTGDTGGGYNIGWTRAGEWLLYTVNVSSSGNYDITTRVAHPGTGSSFHIEVDGVDRTGSLSVPNTNDWQSYVNVTRTGVALTSGTHVIRLAMDVNGTTSGVANFNYINITSSSANQAPTGSFDEVRLSDGVVRGWAYDPDAPSTSSQVHVYVDGPAGSGTLLSGFATNTLRSDVNSSLGISGNHGFEYAIPAQYRNGAQHTIHAYAIDTSSSSISTLLPGSPRSFTLGSSQATVQKTITVDLEGRTTRAVSGTLEVLNPSKALIRSYPFTSNSSGSVTLTVDSSSGSLFFKVKAAPFLTRLISGDINTGLSFPQLKSGDISQDNIVNSIDFSTMNINWFTSHPGADLNADGIVNSLDFSLMNRNWFARGEE